MYRTLLGVSATIALVTLAACTYTKTINDWDVRIEQKPDGSWIGEGKKRSTTETIKIEADSIRKLKRLSPLQEADPTAMDIEVEYRYEYIFDVYDSSDTFVDSIAVATLDDFIAMLPVAFVLAGFEAPPASTLDVLAADAAAVWISPQTHWNLYH